mgnify:CR=1 FL=1
MTIVASGLDRCVKFFVYERPLFEMVVPNNMYNWKIQLIVFDTTVKFLEDSSSSTTCKRAMRITSKTGQISDTCWVFFSSIQDFDDIRVALCLSPNDLPNFIDLHSEIDILRSSMQDTKVDLRLNAVIGDAILPCILSMWTSCRCFALFFEPNHLHDSWILSPSINSWSVSFDCVCDEDLNTTCYRVVFLDEMFKTKSPVLLLSTGQELIKLLCMLA